jgi:hypothetical protein
MLKQDPGVLKALAALPGGPAALDAMVNDFGGKAKSGDAKLFVRNAITARFGPELTDQNLTTKYLPKLYKVLGMVPKSHTKDNPKLAKINRTRPKLMPSGDYDDGVINLNAPRTGLVDSFGSFGARVFYSEQTLTGKDVSLFDALTLHEVGHSVDDNKSYMNGKMGNVRFGGWQNHTIEEVAKAVGQGKGFFEDFKLLPKAMLEAYLLAVLQKKKDPAKESSVTGVPNAPPANDKVWKDLAKHAAVKHCSAIVCNGDNGLWDKGDAGASTYAIGSSVFQQAYSSQWVSYAVSARGAKLTNYQFRAEGEWYAEAYAAFFLGKLPEGHAIYADLDADKKAPQA